MKPKLVEDSRKESNCGLEPSSDDISIEPRLIPSFSYMFRVVSLAGIDGIPCKELSILIQETRLLLVFYGKGNLSASKALIFGFGLSEGFRLSSMSMSFLCMTRFLKYGLVYSMRLSSLLKII